MPVAAIASVLLAGGYRHYNSIKRGTLTVFYHEVLRVETTENLVGPSDANIFRYITVLDAYQENGQ